MHRDEGNSLISDGRVEFRKPETRTAAIGAVRETSSSSDMNGGIRLSQNVHIAANSNLTLYRRLFAVARPYWLHVALFLAVNVLAMPLALLMPLPLKIIVDSVIGSAPPPCLISAVLPRAIWTSADALLVAAVVLLILVTLVGLAQRLGASLLGTYTG